MMGVTSEQLGDGHYSKYVLWVELCPPKELW